MKPSPRARAAVSWIMVRSPASGSSCLGSALRDSGAGGDANDAVAFHQLHGNLAALVDLGEIRELVAPHIARAGGEHDIQFFPLAFIFRQRQDGGDALPPLGQGQQIYHCLALAGDAWASGSRQTLSL